MKLPKILSRNSHRRDVAVCSNASSYRRGEDVPLLLPEINADHIHLVKQQRDQSRLERMHPHESELHEHRSHDRTQGAG